LVRSDRCGIRELSTYHAKWHCENVGCPQMSGESLNSSQEKVTVRGEVPLWTRGEEQVSKREVEMLGRKH